MSVRQFLLVSHRWLGIGAALFLVMLGATGAALVYAEPLDHLLHPTLFRVAEPGVRAPLDRIVAAARARRPDAQPSTLVIPESPTAAMAVRFGAGAVYVDPSRAVVTGERANTNASVVRLIRRLHTSLFVGRPGSALTTLMSLVGVLLAATGVIIWFPRRILLVTRWRTWRGINYDLHSGVGFVSSLVILILCGTAVWMFAWRLDAPIERALGGRPPVPRPVVSPDAGEGSASLDDAVRSASLALPGRVMEIELPRDATEPVTVRMAVRGDRSEHGRSVVHVDPYTARVLAVDDWRDAGTGSRLLAVRDDAHMGSIWGAPTRIIAFVGSLLLIFQSVSGPLIWLKIRPRRRVV